MKIAMLTTDAREPDKNYSNPTPYFGTAPEALLEGFTRMPVEAEVHVVSCLQRPPASSPAKLADNIHYHALVVPNSGWMKTGYSGCIFAVRRKLREIQPDIVHGQGTERDCAITAVFSGFPNVLTIHGNMGRIAEQVRARVLSYYWLAARLERFCVRRSRGVVAISNHTRRLVEPAARRCWLVPNAVHPSFFDIERKPAGPGRILCVAHVNPWKNQAGLIEALEPLAAARPLEMRFAGGADFQTPYGGKFSGAIARNPWCTFLGPLDRGRLRDELAAASLLVLPSFEDNCPMAVLEAAAAGTPVAAAKIGGIPDHIDHGRTGLLFDPQDPEAIRAAVASLLDDPAAAGRMADTARREAREKFSCSAVARRHLEIYAEVLGKGSTAA